MAAEVVGAVVERDLLDAVFADRAALDAPLADHMGAALPTVGAGEDLQVAMAALEAASAMLVLDDGKPVGVITRSDLLIVNKTDLAPLVGADLGIMESDTKRMRGSRPYVFASLRDGHGADAIARFVVEAGGLG